MRFFARYRCDRKLELGIAWAEMHAMLDRTGALLFTGAGRSHSMFNLRVRKFLLVGPPRSVCDSR